MATHRRSWQKREEGVARIFGAHRQVCSGSSGREDRSRSDSNHPRLFIETKLREKHAARSLFDATKALAAKEGKTPILALADKGRPGFLVCVHSDDLAIIVAEYRAANPQAIPGGPPSEVVSLDCSSAPPAGGEAA